MVGLLVIATLALSNAEARDASIGFARAASTAYSELRVVTRSQEDAATAARTATHACLEDWAARPERLTEELTDFYDVVTSAPLWPAQRPAHAKLVDTVNHVRGVGKYRPLRDGRRVLRRQLAYLDRLYSQPIDACAEVKAWRASGWGAPRPPQIGRVHRLVTTLRRHSRRQEVVLYRAVTFVRRHGGKVGRRLDAPVWFGIEAPDNRDNCDDVLVVVAPEESFCG
jgi:hypothetical protein